MTPAKAVAPSNELISAKESQRYWGAFPVPLSVVASRYHLLGDAVRSRVGRCTWLFTVAGVHSFPTKKRVTCLRAPVHRLDEAPGHYRLFLWRRAVRFPPPEERGRNLRGCRGS